MVRGSGHEHPEALMNTVQKIVESDENSTVRVDVPVNGPHRKVEVVVVWHDLDESPRDWPEGWFEETTASIEDPTFVRPDQGDHEPRESLE